MEVNKFPSAKVVVEYEDAQGRRHTLVGNGAGRLEYNNNYEEVDTYFGYTSFPYKSEEVYRLVFDFEPNEYGSYLRIVQVSSDTGEVWFNVRVDVDEPTTANIESARKRAGAPEGALISLEEGYVFFKWQK